MHKMNNMRSKLKPDGRDTIFGPDEDELNGKELDTAAAWAYLWRRQTCPRCSRTRHRSWPAGPSRKHWWAWGILALPSYLSPAKTSGPERETQKDVVRKQRKAWSRSNIDSRGTQLTLHMYFSLLVTRSTSQPVTWHLLWLWTSESGLDMIGYIINCVCALRGMQDLVLTQNRN